MSSPIPSPPGEAPGARADLAETVETDEPDRFLVAWHRFTRAIGHGLQGGAYRVHNARKRIRKG